MAALPSPQRHAGWSDMGWITPESSRGIVTPSLENLTEPYILLDDAREGRGAILFRRPADVAVAWSTDDVPGVLHKVRGALDRGLWVGGYLGYEAGHALQVSPALHPIRAARSPMAWFGFFTEIETIDSVEAALPAPVAMTDTTQPLLTEHMYHSLMARVLAYIEAGDIYQANLTFGTYLYMSAHPLAHYAGLRRAQMAGWGGVVHTGDTWLLSCSPELFFTLESGRLLARPMKGTHVRASDPSQDARNREWLRTSSKDRAENLMIVDLLRNDLSRVAEPGSVKVPELFQVEAYPTLFQMTSSIVAALRPGLDAIHVIEAAFPCGSVTGAPKGRAMEILGELETEQRGPYTGSIGAIMPDGSAAFNGAIRTLELAAGQTKARLGLGSAIVADSLSSLEWRECLAKAGFVHRTTGAASLANRPR